MKETKDKEREENEGFGYLVKSVLDGGQDVLPEAPPTTVLIRGPSPPHPQQGAVQLEDFHLGGHAAGKPEGG